MRLARRGVCGTATHNRACTLGVLGRVWVGRACGRMRRVLLTRRAPHARVARYLPSMWRSRAPRWPRCRTAGRPLRSRVVCRIVGCGRRAARAVRAPWLRGCAPPPPRPSAHYVACRACRACSDVLLGRWRRVGVRHLVAQIWASFVMLPLSRCAAVSAGRAAVCTLRS